MRRNKLNYFIIIETTKEKKKLCMLFCKTYDTTLLDFDHLFYGSTILLANFILLLSHSN